MVIALGRAFRNGTIRYKDQVIFRQWNLLGLAFFCQKKGLGYFRFRSNGYFNIVDFRSVLEVHALVFQVSDQRFY